MIKRGFLASLVLFLVLMNLSYAETLGYKSASWECYDGFKSFQSNSGSCKTYDDWWKLASSSCSGHCSGEGNSVKCGVNSISVDGQCQRYPCTETDTGKDYSTKGTATGYLGISSQNYNPGELYGNFEDYCAASTSTALYEFYCDLNQNGDKWVYQSFYYCPNGCKDGVCITSTGYFDLKVDSITPKETNDFDSSGKRMVYLNYIVKNIGNSASEKFDILESVDGQQLGALQNNAPLGAGQTVSQTLTSPGYYLSSGKHTFKVSILVSGDKDNTNNELTVEFYVSPKPVGCTDSDSGKTYNQKGDVVYTRSDGSKSTISDSCSDIGGQSLSEAYCENGLGKTEPFVQCEFGCSQGACLSKAPVCYDSDSNNDLYLKGYSTIDNGLTKIYDQCGKEQGYQSDSLVLQSYCDNYKLKIRYNDYCPSGCKDGVCIKQDCPLIRCINPPEGCRYEPAYDEKGCPTCGTLVCDTECKTDSDCPVISCITAPCPQNKCVDGRCVQTPTCKDSDGGKNYYKKGKTEASEDHSGGAPGTDRCSLLDISEEDSSFKDVFECNGENCYVVEHFCDGGNPFSNAVICPNGCKDGQCNPSDLQIIGNCGDSDGRDYFTKAITWHKTEESGGFVGAIDICRISMSGVGLSGPYIIEYYCENDKLKRDDGGSCPNGCNDGACLNNCIGLSHYPEIFIKDNKFNGVIVVGDFGTSDEVIAATDILESLKYVEIDDTIHQIPIGSVKLASEVPNIKAVNAIVVGNPCSNAAASVLLNNPQDCNFGLRNGYGVIQMFKNNGFVQVLVSGYSDSDIRAAGTVLANYRDYSLYTFSDTKIAINSVTKKIESLANSCNRDPTYKNAYWECEDGATGRQSTVDCKTNETWRQVAVDDCVYNGHNGAKYIEVSEKCDLNSSCGNSICEKGEDDGIGCKPCTTDHCLAIACIPGTCPQDCGRKCIDSDNGIDIFTKGYTKSGYDEREDSCFGDSVVENYCNDNGIINDDAYFCDFGCSDGACLKEPKESEVKVVSVNPDKKYYELNEKVKITANLESASGSFGDVVAHVSTPSGELKNVKMVRGHCNNEDNPDSPPDLEIPQISVTCDYTADFAETGDEGYYGIEVTSDLITSDYNQNRYSQFYTIDLEAVEKYLILKDIGTQKIESVTHQKYEGSEYSTASYQGDSGNFVVIIVSLDSREKVIDHIREDYDFVLNYNKEIIDGNVVYSHLEFPTKIWFWTKGTNLITVIANSYGGEGLDFPNIVTLAYLEKHPSDLETIDFNSYDLKLKAGWNLFSTPVLDTENHLFSSYENDCDFTTDLWKYSTESKSYVKTDKIANSKDGFWIKTSRDCKVKVKGDGYSNYNNYLQNFNLKSGWNVIGGSPTQLWLDGIKNNCNIVRGPYSYNPQARKYEKSEYLEAGKGYLLSVSSDCRLGYSDSVPVGPQESAQSSIPNFISSSMPTGKVVWRS